MTKTEPISDLVADEPGSGLQALEGLASFLLITNDGDQDVGGFSIRGKLNVGDRGESDAWVGEFAFDEGRNLLTKGFGESA